MLRPATWVADTVADLERDIGLAPGSLQSTVAAYNAGAARGEDPLPHKTRVGEADRIPHSRDVVEWLSDHRKRSPYPVRHHATNVHRTGTAARSPARGVSTALALSTLDQMPEGYEVGL